MDLKHVQIWTVVVNDKPVRVATVEHGPRKPSLCGGCPAPCCQGMFHPVLTEQEFKQRKFPTKFLPAPAWLLERTSHADAIATLAMFEQGCRFFDHETALCTAWPDCPKGCLSYDCREDTRGEIREFAQQRMKEHNGRDGSD